MFRSKSSVSSLAGRSTPLGAKDRKNLRQQFLTQFKRQTVAAFDSLCPPNSSLSIFSVKGAACDIYVCDGVPILQTHSSKKKSAALIPTVFALWALPDLLPRMVCQEPVFEFLLRGADFMVPGCVNRKAIEYYTINGDYPPDDAGIRHVYIEKPEAAAEDDGEQPGKVTDTQKPASERYPLGMMEEGSYWSIGCIGQREPFAVGEVVMPFEEFRTADKGKLLVVTHVIGDLLFRLCPAESCVIPECLRASQAPAVVALLSAAPSDAPSSEPPKAPTGTGKNAPVSPPLRRITAYQPLNHVRELLMTTLDVDSIKQMLTQSEIGEMFATVMRQAYVSSLNYPSLGTDSQAVPPPPPTTLPPYAEIARTNQPLSLLCLTKRERQGLREGANIINDDEVLRTFLNQGFRRLTILAPENADGEVNTANAIVLEGEPTITICVKKTKRFIRTQVSNIHKFRHIEPKQLAERLQRACAAAASVAEMDDIKGNPPGVLVQGSVPQECAALIHKTYGIPMDMIVIS